VIDRVAKNVTAINKKLLESKFAYDVLILAQGGRPIVPPFSGVEQDNVFQQ
jgi:NADPH-dependent 2,4-dienoyl-CoA reductase/sulfur reductase-like enzyme